jgi:hypothetical protein
MAPANGCVALLGCFRLLISGATYLQISLMGARRGEGLSHLCRSALCHSLPPRHLVCAIICLCPVPRTCRFHLLKGGEVWGGEGLSHLCTASDAAHSRLVLCHLMPDSCYLPVALLLA